MRQTLFKTSIPHTLTLDRGEIQRLFFASSVLTDVIEDILESRGEYSKEFLNGLKKSFKEVTEGKITEIASLKELS